MVERVYKALLSGASAEEVLTDIEGMPSEQREMLFCMLSGIRNELAVNCLERAIEVDRVLGAKGLPAKAAESRGERSAQPAARSTARARKSPA